MIQANQLKYSPNKEAARPTVAATNLFRTLPQHMAKPEQAPMRAPNASVQMARSLASGILTVP